MTVDIPSRLRETASKGVSRFAVVTGESVGEDEPAEAVAACSIPGGWGVGRVLALPPRRLRDRGILCADSPLALLDAYSMLRARVLYLVNEVGHDVIGVTSPVRGEGRTLTAINLALSLASGTSRPCVLIDMDLRSPSGLACLGERLGPGLEALSENRLPLSACLSRVGPSGPVLLPAERMLDRDAQDRLFALLPTILDALRQHFDAPLFVLDLPPVL